MGQYYYKSGQLQLLQIEAIVITNRGKIITNLGSYYGLGQNYYKSGQVLQIGAVITNRCRITCEKVSQKIRHNLFINASTEKNK